MSDEKDLCEKIENCSINDDIDIKNKDGLEYMKGVENNSVDLILTDPPYLISRETRMDKHYNTVKSNEKIKSNMSKQKKNGKNTKMIKCLMTNKN